MNGNVFATINIVQPMTCKETLMNFSIPIQTQSIHPDPAACLANAHAKDGPQANAGIEPLSQSNLSTQKLILHDTKDFYIQLYSL